MFEIDKTLSFNTDKLVDGNDFDYVTRTSFNQGILRQTGFVNSENINLPSTWSLGLLQMDFFYRSKPWYAGQFVRKITPKFDVTESNILFFSSILNGLKPKLLSVLVRSVDKVFIESTIYLPTKNGKIDFEFMESFVAELEAQLVAELEAYLTVTGLKDYELTEEERDVLLSFKNLNLKESEIGKLFEIRPTKAYSYTNYDLFDKNGKYPVVTNSSNNNGITGYTNLSPTEKGNIITYSDTTTSEGIFYQPENFVGYSHIQGLYPLVFKDKWNCNTLLYIVSTFKKSSSGRFDYGNKFNRKIAEKLKIYIPIKNCEIDFVFMETLIRAVQKLVIKDVVLFADKKIEVTKKITNI